MSVQLREVECPVCRQIFFVCQRCDFGRLYCCKPCRRKARKQNLRRAQRKYASSTKGRLNNRDRQRRFRIRRRTAWNNRTKPNSVTHQSSQLLLPGVSCSHDEPPAAPGPTEPLSTVSSTPTAPVQQILLRALGGNSGSETTNDVAEHAYKTTSQSSGLPTRVAQCHLCGRWGEVVESTAIRGRFRRRSHGKYMNLRRTE